MNKLTIILAITVFQLFTNANAALVERLGGLAYFDTETNLTWLADANYSRTSGYDLDGMMTWQQANDWVAQLNIDGVNGWRLPTTLQPDSSCQNNDLYGSHGSNCFGSEMGNLFYNVFGGSAGYSLTSNANYDLFSNVQSSFFCCAYWSETEHSAYSDSAWIFLMTGVQGFSPKSTNGYYAWAVHDGDVETLASVPVPTAVWLFGSGMIVMFGLAKRKF